MPVPVVAVVGRPNVGKSTLVNRLARTAEAIVYETSGVTRDRSYHRTDWNGREFLVVDTGGIDLGGGDIFAESVSAQALAAVEEADVILLLVDGLTGPQAADEDVARILKRSEKPVFLVVNKLDEPRREAAAHEFWALGLGEPWPVSAVHGHGTGDLLDDVVAALPPEHPEEGHDEIRVAIIGKPNAGKSSLLNRLAGKERAVVSEVPGTTRDTIDTLVERDGTLYRLLDTAGLRRKSKSGPALEFYSALRATRAIERSDVSLLVLDAAAGVTDQDQRVAAFAAESGCALVVLLNKWDLMTEDEDRKRLEDAMADQLAFVSYAPVLRVSAVSGRGAGRIFEAVDLVFASYSRQFATSELNKLLTELRDVGHTVSRQGRTLRLGYVTQTHRKPPGFTFFANDPKLVDESYRRYLENRLRERFDLTGTPVILKFRQKG